MDLLFILKRAMIKLPEHDIYDIKCLESVNTEDEGNKSGIFSNRLIFAVRSELRYLLSDASCALVVINHQIIIKQAMKHFGRFGIHFQLLRNAY